MSESPPQMCTVDDWIGGKPCLRVAQWRIAPEGDHPLFLCHFHAEPFTSDRDWTGPKPERLTDGG